MTGKTLLIIDNEAEDVIFEFIENSHWYMEDDIDIDAKDVFDDDAEDIVNDDEEDVMIYD